LIYRENTTTQYKEGGLSIRGKSTEDYQNARIFIQSFDV